MLKLLGKGIIIQKEKELKLPLTCTITNAYDAVSKK
jgi:hypothetical protein